MQAAESDKNKAGTAVYKCPVKLDHVGSRSPFEYGVPEIQYGMEEELTLSEARTVRIL